MKRLIEYDVIQINYEKFLTQYKNVFPNEEAINEKELYEHFIINHLSYSRPNGCLPPNYFNIKEGYLKGINLFEIIEYVNISERMFKCQNDTEEDDLKEKTGATCGDGEYTGEEGMSSDEDEEEEEEKEEEEEDKMYIKGKRGRKKKKTIPKFTKTKAKKNLSKKQNNIYNNNDNYGKCKRVYRFLLFDGKRFIYAYEDEFNELFNFLDTEEYIYPKIILYNNPVIRSGILLIRKDQALILFKGYKTTSQKIKNPTEQRNENKIKKENYNEKKEDDCAIIKTTKTVKNAEENIYYTKKNFKNYSNFIQPQIEKKELMCIETNNEIIRSSYFKNKSETVTAPQKAETTFANSSLNVNLTQSNCYNNEYRKPVPTMIPNYDIEHGTPTNQKQCASNTKYDSNENYTNNQFNPIANFDNDERKMWEQKWEKKKLNENTKEIKNQCHNHNFNNLSLENIKMKSSNNKKEIDQNEKKTNTSNDNLKNTNEEAEIIDLTADFFNSDFFVTAIGSGNSDKNEDVILIDD